MAARKKVKKKAIKRSGGSGVPNVAYSQKKPSTRVQNAQKISRAAVGAAKKAAKRTPVGRVVASNRAAGRAVMSATSGTRAGASDDARRISRQIRNWTG